MMNTRTHHCYKLTELLRHVAITLIRVNHIDAGAGQHALVYYTNNRTRGLGRAELYNLLIWCIVFFSPLRNYSRLIASLPVCTYNIQYILIYYNEQLSAGCYDTFTVRTPLIHFAANYFTEQYRETRICNEWSLFFRKLLFDFSRREND